MPSLLCQHIRGKPTSIGDMAPLASVHGEYVWDPEAREADPLNSDSSDLTLVTNFPGPCSSQLKTGVWIW